MSYGDDLSFIHDAGFGDFARGAAPFVVETLGRPGRVAEIGCGSGILAAALVEAGFEVWGIDISAAMVELARARVPGATFEVGSLYDARLPEACAGVVAMGEVLSYAFDEAAGERGLAEVLARVHAALRPGGAFLFDVAGPARGDVPRHKHVEAEDWALLLDIDVRDARLTRTMTVFRRDGDHFRRSREVHTLHLFEPDRVEAMLREAGLSVERLLPGYGDAPLPVGLHAFCARRA